MKKILCYLLLLFGILSLTGCEKHIYQGATSAISQTRQQIQHQQQIANTLPPPVIVKKGFYVNTTPIKQSSAPAWLKKPVVLQAKGVPLRILLNRLLRNSSVVVSFDRTVNPMRPVSLDYRGTVSGALKALQASTHYAYSLDKDQLSWSAFETKTFDISFMPGNSSYLVGRGQTGGASAEGAPQAALPTAAVMPGAQQGHGGPAMDGQEYSSMEGELSIWEDVKKTLDDLKSPDGKVIVSESTTSVTVRDHPENVALMKKYIDQLNHTLSQQVGIKVQVLEIQLKKEFNFGINWNLVAHTLGTSFSLLGKLANATNPLTSNIISNGENSGVATFQVGKDENNALLQALGQQGALRVVTKPEVVTMNNQIAVIRITQDTGYIESVNSSFTDNYVTTSITPGSVTDGFTLYILSKIQGEKVFMQISSTISNLIRLEKESTAPTGQRGNALKDLDKAAHGGNRGSENSQYNAIEVPTIAEKTFNQRSVIQSGHTLIIAGYKQLRDATNTNSLFGIKQLGGKGAETRNIETLVLITPVILQS